MLEPRQIDQLINTIATMDRQTIKEQFLGFRASFPVDFTDEFLDRLPLDRLRHIFLAFCIQNDRAPSDLLSTAA